jgi:two-component system, sensor histidine kinase PdtaS
MRFSQFTSMKKLAIFLFLPAISLLCNAQHSTDSLKNLLRASETKGDSALIKYYTAYIGYFYHSGKAYDSALNYYRIVLSQKSINADTALLATTLNGVGACYNGLGYPDSSLNNYAKALQLFILLKDTVRAIDVEANIAIVYKDIGLYEKALEAAFSLLAKLITRPPDRALASCYNTIALVYELTGDFHYALDYHRKALFVRKGLHYKKGEGQSYHNIGEVYRSLNKYDSALSNLSRALEIKTELDDENGSSSTFNSIGRVYLDLNKPVAAEQYLIRSLAIARKSNDKRGQAITLKDLGRLKLMLRQYSEAAPLLSESERLSREAKLIDNLHENLELKITLLKGQGDYSKAVSVYQELLVIRDSLLNTEKAKSMKSLEIRYETEQKEQQITLLEQRDKTNLAELQTKQIQIRSLSAGIFLLFVIVALILYSASNTRKNKLRIETLHKELHHRVKNNLQILSSILSLQAEQLTDADAINAARSTESRINAMALIHRKLYNVDNNRSIDIRGYVQELMQYLMHAYGFDESKIKLNVEIPQLHVDVDRIIPLGLILNELISNAFKYAFIDHADPRLNLSIHQYQNRLLIIVGDNGLGFDNTASGTNASFGIKMVGMLIKELRGNFSVQTQNGTRYNINIPTA